MFMNVLMFNFVFGWIILCDFDGIIFVEDVIDLLFDCYGCFGWEVLE